MSLLEFLFYSVAAENLLQTLIQPDTQETIILSLFFFQLWEQL